MSWVLYWRARSVGLHITRQDRLGFMSKGWAALDQSKYLTLTSTLFSAACGKEPWLKVPIMQDGASTCAWGLQRHWAQEPLIRAHCSTSCVLTRVCQAEGLQPWGDSCRWWCSAWQEEHTWWLQMTSSLPKKPAFGHSTPETIENNLKAGGDPAGGS